MATMAVLLPLPLHLPHAIVFLPCPGSLLLIYSASAPRARARRQGPGRCEDTAERLPGQCGRHAPSRRFCCRSRLGETLPVRLRARLRSRVRVPAGDTLCSVQTCNCVVVRQGGEQQERNFRAVGDEPDSVRCCGETAGTARSPYLRGAMTRRKRSRSAGSLPGEDRVQRAAAGRHRMAGDSTEGSADA